MDTMQSKLLKKLTAAHCKRANGRSSDFAIKGKTRIQTIAKGCAGIFAAFTLWQLAALLVDTQYFPSAWTIVKYSFGLLFEPTFIVHVYGTVQAMLAGLALAALIAVPAGLLLGRYPLAYRLTRLLVETLRPIPAVALAPLAILMFGLSERATISLVVWTSIWPILINSIYGMHNVDQLFCQTARTFGFGRWETLLKVELPSSAPFIATGIRIALSIALSVAIAGEMVAGSGQGLGGWILQESASGSLNPVYSATFISGLLGYAINMIMEYAEHRLFFWHTSFRKKKGEIH
ncbi:ABC transporter permease [Ferviditalea candida]|uniref:ABC transporter permease n=1 Tax=Ferviditalea candida TaxID=3108399 RepID=A0ABU5ZMA7_9BACL|nr:ABC transporter permease [Paenibacillaceae bacterium T2]